MTKHILVRVYFHSDLIAGHLFSDKVFICEKEIIFISIICYVNIVDKFLPIGYKYSAQNFLNMAHIKCSVSSFFRFLIKQFKSNNLLKYTITRQVRKRKYNLIYY